LTLIVTNDTRTCFNNKARTYDWIISMADSSRGVSLWFKMVNIRPFSSSSNVTFTWYTPISETNIYRLSHDCSPANRPRINAFLISLFKFCR
jgi:hypothetical protein